MFTRALGACLLLSAAALAGEPDAVARAARVAFRELVPRQPGRDWIAGADGASLAWGESYRLAGWLAMFEATGDEASLAVVFDRFEAILAMRDDRRGLEDALRGRVMPAWGTSRYSKGRRTCWIVHAGMITAPVARACYLVRRSAALGERFGARVAPILAAIEETVAAFEASWRSEATGSEGWYFGRAIGKALPFNQQNALGRTLLALWLATGRERYRLRVEALARFYRQRLERVEGAYRWAYAPGGRGAEDISHAAINVDFAVSCHRAGLVFEAEDMARFAATFERCRRAAAGFSKRVDGSGDLSYSLQMGRWARLGLYAPTVRTALSGYFEARWKGNLATGLCAAGLLARAPAPVAPEGPWRAAPGAPEPGR